MWVGEGGGLVEEVGERFGGVGQAVFAAPSDPSGLGEFCVSGQGVGEGLDVDDPVSGDRGDGGAEYGFVVRAGGQVGDVDEVAPAGVGGASLDGGDDLFGQDEFDAVAGDRDWGTAEESWYVDDAGWRGERVAGVDVDVEPDACGGENVVDDGSEVFGVTVDIGGSEVKITSGRVGATLRLSNTSRRTPPLRTKWLLWGEVASRSRKPSRPYNWLSSLVGRPESRARWRRSR